MPIYRLDNVLVSYIFWTYFCASHVLLVCTYYYKSALAIIDDTRPTAQTQGNA